MSNRLQVMIFHASLHDLDDKYPGQLGWLMGPSGFRNPRKIQFALDNDRFSCWSKGKGWDYDMYVSFLDRVQSLPTAPKWALVPDTVADAEMTFRQWEEYLPLIESRRMTPALAVQDGMTPDSVRRCCGSVPVIFVGGSTDWKRRTMWQWCHEFPRVHVGRINTERWLWNAARCGAESCDGTGWFRGDQRQLRGLFRFLEHQKSGSHPAQLELEFARSFGGHVPNKSLCTETSD